jgi:hypothetical protein
MSIKKIAAVRGLTDGRLLVRITTKEPRSGLILNITSCIVTVGETGYDLESYVSSTISGFPNNIIDRIKEDIFPKLFNNKYLASFVSNGVDVATIDV